MGRHPPGQTPSHRQTPPGRRSWADTPWADGQQAGGTHPTGMHSCAKNETMLVGYYRFEVIAFVPQTQTRTFQTVETEY